MITWWSFWDFVGKIWEWSWNKEGKQNWRRSSSHFSWHQGALDQVTSLHLLDEAKHSIFCFNLTFVPLTDNQTNPSCNLNSCCLIQSQQQSPCLDLRPMSLASSPSECLCPSAVGTCLVLAASTSCLPNPRDRTLTSACSGLGAEKATFLLVQFSTYYIRKTY